MDSQWLAFLVVKATLLLLAGVLAAAALRRAAAGARHLVWLATLAGVMLLPGMLRVSPLRLEVLPAGVLPTDRAASAPAAAAPLLDATRTEPLADDAVTARPLPAAPAPRGRLAWPGLLPALLGAWALVAAVLLAAVLRGSAAARRVLRTARALDDPRWTALLRDLADRLDMPDTPRLLASDSVDIPFACGVWRSTIVLPGAARDWPDERRQMVLLHELAHVRRRDLLGQELGRVACALYWFHPLVWMAARRLRAESERACDDLVLACGARASDYAGHLLDILTAARGHGAPAMALPMARRREFEGRLLAILDADRRRRGPGRWPSLALVALLSAVFLAVAATAPAPPAQASVTNPLSPWERGRGEGGQAAAQPDSPAQKANRAQKRSPSAPPQPEQPNPQEQRRQQKQVDPQIESDEKDQESPPVTGMDRERRDMILHVLRTDPDAAVRRSAAWALADRTQPVEAAVLLGTLRDDADAGVREMAAWALADSRNGGSGGAGEPPQLDRGAGFNPAPRDDANAAFAQALRKDTAAEVRATAAWALGRRRGADTATLVAALADPAANVREAALWALGQHRVEPAPAALTEALRDRDPRIRLLAAWALGEIQDPSTAPAMRAAFVKEDDVEARRAIFRALAFMGDRSPEFLDRAAAAKDPELRSRAMLILGGLGPGIWPWPWPWPQPRPMP